MAHQLTDDSSGLCILSFKVVILVILAMVLVPQMEPVAPVGVVSPTLIFCKSADHPS